MTTIKGPGIFLAQFIQNNPPYNNLEGIASWASGLGYRGIQAPTWDLRVFDLETASVSKQYCDDFKGRLALKNLEVIELASYIQGQVLAMHPVQLELFQPFFPNGLNLTESSRWAAEQLSKTIQASVHLGTNNISVLSGGFAWHLMYPWPQQPEGIMDEAFTELANRWKPLLNMANEHGITFGFELHPVSDLHDGITYEKFLDKTGNHPAACLTYDPSHLLLQQMDYAQFIDWYHERIRAVHIKDAEFNPNGKSGVYGGYQSWKNRAGRFRSPGDGQIDFKRIFTLLTQYGYHGWAILEWECCIKSPEAGAAEGAKFITDHMINSTDSVFDDFAGGKTDKKRNRRLLGLEDEGKY